MALKLQNSDSFVRSKPHKRVEKILDSIGLAYESEREFYPYTVDVYMPEWHIAVEIDGPYHTRKKDELRDQKLLENYGLPILRLKTKDGIDHDVVEKAVLDFIDIHYEDSEVRRYAWLKTMHSNV